MFDPSKITVQELQFSASRLGEIDSKISSLYHIIELIDVDAVTMVKLYKELKEALIVRRYWKEVRAVAQSLRIETLKSKAETRESKYKEEAQKELYKLKSEKGI